MNIHRHANATTTPKTRRYIQGLRPRLCPCGCEVIAKAPFTITQLFTDNGDVLRTHRFDSSTSLQATLKRFVYLYNHHIPQKGLHHKSPLQTLQKWYSHQPQLFKKIPRNGDTLTAATALVHHLDTATANVKDYAWIDDLEIVNPWT